jgi:aldose 1-epimerase
MYTDQTDVQFYTGNFLEGQPDFDGGVRAIFHGGFCLEAQTEPNSANHGVGIYNAGEVYSSTIVYKVDKL